MRSNLGSDAPATASPVTLGKLPHLSGLEFPHQYSQSTHDCIVLVQSHCLPVMAPENGVALLTSGEKLTPLPRVGLLCFVT